ncbi:MAG: alpha-amylase family glycosyl hydrolase [Myxococcota bacterium]
MFKALFDGVAQVAQSQPGHHGDSMVELDAEMAASSSAWAGSGAVMAPILGNHDVPRFISDVHGDPIWTPRLVTPEQPTEARPYRLLKMAWTFLLTQPGAPVIYYGDEIGMAGANDPDNRRNMRFDAEVDPLGLDVHTHVKTLGLARACSPALRRGTRRTWMAHEHFLLYSRDVGDGHPALVILNRATLPREVTLTVPTELALADGARFHDRLGSPVEMVGRTVTVTVPAEGSALLMTRCTEENP